MKIATINRTAVTIIPKQPYIDWANSFEDGVGDEKIYATTILIPDKYGEFDYEVYLKKIFKDVFEEQLESWMANPDNWPPKRTYKIFTDWFGYQMLITCPVRVNYLGRFLQPYQNLR